jgi:integrase
VGRVHPLHTREGAQYIAAHAEKLKPESLKLHLAAIHNAHVDAGRDSPVRDPLVKKTMEGIQRTYGAAPRRVKALIKDDILDLLQHVAQYQPMKAARDKAIILLGFGFASRRSELAALDVTDIVDQPNGIDVIIRRSKTDQRGEGQTVFVPKSKVEGRCPVRALRAWLEVACITAGPIFRRINRHDQVIGTGALTGQAIALVVKYAVSAAWGEEAAAGVAGHSLRAGYATTSAMAGRSPAEAMMTTRHKSVSVLAVYWRMHEQRQMESLV